MAENKTNSLNPEITGSDWADGLGYLPQSPRPATLTERDVLRLIAKYHVQQVPPVVRDISTTVVNAKDTARKVAEDIRANRRNRNRAISLLVALLMSFLFPWFILHVAHDPKVLAYSTGLVILLDSFVTLWAYLRRY